MMESSSFFASLSDAQLKRALKRLVPQVWDDDRAFRAARALSRPPTLIEIEPFSSSAVAGIGDPGPVAAGVSPAGFIGAGYKAYWASVPWIQKQTKTWPGHLMLCAGSRD